MQNSKQWKLAASLALTATLVGCAHHSPMQNTTAEAQPDSAQLVKALNGVFGSHAHSRASHTKGFCAAGDFMPSPHASELVASPMFKKASVPAEIRFSMAGGNPKASDKSRSPRGLAASISDGNERYDLVLISEPVFFASTPLSFVSFLEARVPDPATKKPNPEKIKAHSHKYPESKLQSALAGAHPAPVSYASTPYFSTSAFKFTNEQHKSQFARIVLEPAKGKYYLSEEQEHSFSDDFLHAEFKARVEKAPAEFTVYAQLPGKGDSVTDSATIWAEDRARVELGKLVIKHETDQACDAQVFSPTNLPTGVEPSDDPILKSRAGAYAVSKGKRSH